MKLNLYSLICWKLFLGGLDLYVDIETCIAFCCIVLRELGGCTGRSLRWGASRGRLICRTNLNVWIANVWIANVWIANAWIAGDAAGRHRNSAGQYGHTAPWDRDATRWHNHSPNHSWVRIAQRNSNHDSTGLEFAGHTHARQHYPAVNHKSQHAK